MDDNKDTKQEQVSKPSVIEVEIDGEVKQFTAEDVINLKKMQKSATDKFQKASPVLNAVEKYGFESADEYISQTDYAMDVVHKLMQDGIIDAEGNVVKKQDLPPLDNESIFSPPKSNNTDDVIAKALGRIEGKLNEKFDGLSKRQEMLERIKMVETLRVRQPSLSDRAIGEVFAKASKDRNKSILLHADDVAKDELTNLQILEKAFAEKYGVDINKRREMSPDGGAAALASGKKVQFKNRTKKWGNQKHDPGSADPKEMMREYFDRLNSQ